MRKSAAFTLIELLIVIAIIAILALIAIPNFLEAQVRSKVARCHADMRSLGSALAAYAVDYGRTPLSGDETSELTTYYGANWWPGAEIALRPVTTPVAYIASLPIDSFAEKGFASSGKPADSKANKTFGYETGTSKWWQAGRGYVPRLAGDWCYRLWKKGYYWTLSSLGPARSGVNPGDGGNTAPYGVLTGDRPMWLYDPTNGTVSFGYILYTNKGGVTVPEKP